jgi:hypothetical protein
MVDALLEAFALLEEFLAFSGLIPEVRSGGLLFYKSELGFLFGGVKDSSAQLQIAGGATYIPARVRRWSYISSLAEQGLGPD